MSTSSSPRSARSCCSATLTMPSAASACEPTGSFSPGMPNSISPPMPASAASCAALRSESRVCWTTPGIDEIGTGSSMPCLTNTGSTKSAGASRVCAVSRRSAGVDRSRRPRANPDVAPPTVTVPRLPPRPGAAAANSASASTSGRDGRGLRLHVDPQPELLRAGRGGRADHRDDGLGVRLAGDADQVAHRARRGEAHRVEPAALDRLAHRRRRRRRPHGPVGGDVVDLPAALDQAGGQGLGGDVGARQQHPVDRVEHVVVRREVGQQALAGLLAGGHAAPARCRRRARPAAVCSPTQATFTPANARASRPSSANFSRTAFTALTEVNTIQP